MADTQKTYKHVTPDWLVTVNKTYDKAMGIITPIAIVAFAFWIFPILNNEGAPKCIDHCIETQE